MPKHQASRLKASERRPPKPGYTGTRDITFRAEDIDEENRTVEVAFSSESEIERGFGLEILDHDPASVRLDRLNGGGAVLVNHWPDDQVGAVQSARIDDDKKGRATLKLSRSTLGEEIFNDVKDGIRNLISVGYRVHKWSIAEKRGQPTRATAVDWEPLEISFVAVPADASVGVGRADPAVEELTNTEVINMPDNTPDNTPETRDNETPAPAQPAPATPVIDAQAEISKVRGDEMRRINQIRAMAEAHDMEELGREAITEGWSYRQFNETLLGKIGERNNETRATTTESGNVDMSTGEAKKYSLTRLMYALAYPQERAAQEAAAFEWEVSAAGSRAIGGDFKARGAYVPADMLNLHTRTLTAGTATDGAELVASNLLAGSYIEVLRNAMTVAQAGATMLPGLVGNTDIPRQTSGAASAWISTEGGNAANSEAQFDQVQLTPKDLACYTDVTRRLVLQSTPAIVGIVRRDLAVAQAIGIDLAALHGSGASGQPTGVENTTSVNSFNFAAADPTYAETIRMVKEVMTDNALMGSLAYIIDPNGWEAAKTTEKASGTAQFIMSDDTMNGYRTFVTNQVTDEDWFFGNWSDVLIGEWGGLEINVDPYTNSLAGTIRFVTFKTVDVGVRHPGSFCHCNDGV